MDFNQVTYEAAVPALELSHSTRAGARGAHATFVACACSRDGQRLRLCERQ